MSDKCSINRRDFCKLSAAGTVTLLSGCQSVISARPHKDQSGIFRPNQQKPNIIFILADDLGYGDVRYFGNPLVQTPNLDHMASQGISLTQHYTAAPICAPARASLLTGMYPQRTGLLMTYKWQGINPNMKTMGHLLGKAGYATGLVGKWHLENWSTPNVTDPDHMGFQEVVKTLALSDYWKWDLWKNGTKIDPDGRYMTDVLTDEAIDYITRHQKENFFLYLAYTAPHYPLQSRKEDAEIFRQNGCTEGQAVTYGMIRRLDYGIGRVMETLNKLGLDDNTMVIFASDNGPYLGIQDGIDQKRYNGYLAGGKGLINEGGIRVPGIVRWPAGLGKDPRTCQDFVHFVDWLPTCLAAAGLKPPQELDIDGINILPTLLGENNTVNASRFWAWSWSKYRIDSNAAVRDGDWKLLRPFMIEQSGCCPNPPMPDDQMPPPKPLQLFNLKLDPYESNDMSALYPDRVKVMENELSAWFERTMIDFKHASQWLNKI